MNSTFIKKDGHHPMIELDYQKNQGGIVFSDGVVYTNDEIAILKQNSGFDYKTIHNAKKIFNGEIVEWVQMKWLK